MASKPPPKDTEPSKIQLDTKNPILSVESPMTAMQTVNYGVSQYELNQRNKITILTKDKGQSQRIMNDENKVKIETANIQELINSINILRKMLENPDKTKEKNFPRMNYKLTVQDEASKDKVIDMIKKLLSTDSNPDTLEALSRINKIEITNGPNGKKQEIPFDVRRLLTPNPTTEEVIFHLESPITNDQYLDNFDKIQDNHINIVPQEQTNPSQHISSGHQVNIEAKNIQDLIARINHVGRMVEDPEQPEKFPRMNYKLTVKDEASKDKVINMINELLAKDPNPETIKALSRINKIEIINGPKGQKQEIDFNLGRLAPADAETRNKRITDLMGDNAFSESVKKRGEAFIAGAELIIKNHPESELTKKLQNAQGKEDKESLNKVEIIRQNWNKRKTHDEESIQVLMKVLAEEVNKKINGNGDLNKIIDEDLSHAENHYNWTRGKEKYSSGRETLKEYIELDENTVQIRVDEPITKFTKDQEKQWEAILNPDETHRPKWFRTLPRWEQNHLSSRIKEWEIKCIQNNNNPPNLGDFLGVPPTTIRAYPGVRNGYKSFFYTYKRDKTTNQFVLASSAFKIRTGHISPDKMEDDKERMDSVKNNIKQLILVHAQEQLNQGKTNLLFDLQTLITPPFKGKDRKMDGDRLKAIAELRIELTPEKYQTFLEKNNVEFDKSKPPTLTLITSNYPVNPGRSFGNLFSALFSRFIPTAYKRNSENDFALTALKTTFSLQTKDQGKREKEGKPILEAEKNNLKMAGDALKKIDSMNGFFRRIANFTTRGLNHNAERAALEQIAVSGLGGVRAGSCMSGKDREGGVSEHVAAMTAFYGKYGKFPPTPSRFTLNPWSKDNGLDDKNKDPHGKTEKEYRDEYENMVAKEFLAGYEQRIAQDNAWGSNGLKDVKGILGKNVMKKAKKILVNQYFKDEPADVKAYWNQANLSKISKQIASLNRIEEYQSSPKIYNSLSKPPETPILKATPLDQNITAALTPSLDLQQKQSADQKQQEVQISDQTPKSSISPKLGGRKNDNKP